MLDPGTLKVPLFQKFNLMKMKLAFNLNPIFFFLSLCHYDKVRELQATGHKVAVVGDGVRRYNLTLA